MIKAIHTRLDQREEGFTLIELLVVVIIIGILAAVAIPVFLNQRQRAYRAAMQSDLRNVAVEAETFFSDNNSYVGFDTGPVFAGRETGAGGYRESNGVNLTLVPAHATATRYCITAEHTASAEVWNIRPGNDLGQVGVGGRTVCP